MAIRTYKVTLDSKNTIAPEPVLLRQGDKTGAVVIDATLMDNGSPVSLSGLTPSFIANTADGKAVVSDTTGFSIVDAPGGEFMYQVPSQLGSVAGKIKIAYFSFSDSSGAQSTFNVVFVVARAADMTQDSAKDWVSNLNEIISQYNQWVNDAHSSWQDFVNENKEIIKSIDPGGTLLTEIIAARNGKSDLKTRLDDEHAQFTEQLAQKADKDFIYVEDHGAVGDGVTDDTIAFQSAIDYASSTNGTIKLKNKTYALTNMLLKANISMTSDSYCILKILDSANTSFIKLDSGVITNLTYNYYLENMFIACNPNNKSQVILDLTALKSASNEGGGAWHCNFNNIRIQTLTGSQIGLRLKAVDSENSNVDVANQYLKFENINIYRGSDASQCLNITGQIGQTEFDRCEFNGSGSTLLNYNVVFNPSSTSNDSAFMPITFNNCTFQSSEKGIYGNGSHLILNYCHFENIAQGSVVVKGDRGIAEINGCNFSGGIYPCRIDGTGVINGDGNTWLGPTGFFCKLDTPATGNYAFNINIYRSSNFICEELPYYNFTGITLNTGYSKNIFLSGSVTGIQIIRGSHKIGDLITITNAQSTTCKIENNDFTVNSNLYWSGAKVIALNQYDSVTFICKGNTYYLVSKGSN